MPIADSLKPRASANTQLALAATVWTLAAIILGARGISWIPAEAIWLVATPVAVGLGLLKAHFLLDPLARRMTERIVARGRDRCAGGFFPWQSWLMIVVMMSAGHALRLTAIPRPLLGLAYVLISAALLWATRIYWSGVRGLAQ